MALRIRRLDAGLLDRLARGHRPRISDRDARSFPGAIAPYIGLAESAGIPWRRTLRASGVDADPADPTFRIRISQVSRFLDGLAGGDLGPDVAFGAAHHDGAAVEPPALRKARRTAPDLLHAFCGVREHAQRVGGHFQVWFELTPSHLWICSSSYARGTQVGTIQSEVMRTLRLAAAVHAFVGDDWRPELIGVTSPRTATSGLREWMRGGRIHHGLPYCAFPVPVPLLRRSERARRGSAAGPGAGDGEGPQGGGIGPIDLLDAVLPSALAVKRASLPEAAEMVGMSSRTLQRYLEHRGTSYRRVVGEARVREARRLLLDSPLPIQQISHRLGYRNPSSFTRAFRRAHGLSPSDVRRLAPGDDCGRIDEPDGRG